MRIQDKKKIALVLSGGGIKAAAFHIGVCMALKEKGFNFIGGTPEYIKKNYKDTDTKTVKLYVGSSAGSFISSILASGYSVESIVNAFEVGLGYKKTFANFGLSEMKPLSYRHLFSVNGTGIIKSIPNFFKHRSLMTGGGWESIIKNSLSINGFFTTKGIEGYLRKHVLPVNDFSQLGVELFIIGTQLNHSRKVIFGNFPSTTKDKNTMYANFAKISEAVAASGSLPPVYAPYGIKDGEKELFFFDGEIRDTLSTHVAADYGADLVISSYSVQPYHYTPELGSLHQYGLPVILNQALYQVIQQKIEKHIEHQQEIRTIYNAVEGYLRQANIDVEHRRKVLEIIERRVGFKPEVDYIYIHPKAYNHEMFFVDHFSLNPKVMDKIVRIGFKAGISTLRQYGI